MEDGQNRQKRGNVILMIKSKIKVINVEYGKEKTELIIAQIKTKQEKSKRQQLYMYQQKTKNWTKEKHEEIIEDILESLEKKLLKAVRE